MKYLIIALLFLSNQIFAQKNQPRFEPLKNFTCTTFVYNLTLGEMKMRDLCFTVIKGEYTNLNDFSNNKKKEDEFWRFKISIKDNKTQSIQTYEAAFFIYENGTEITQYHPIVGNDELKAVIYNKSNNSWQILLNQNDEYKILSSYTGYHYTNAFGIREKKKNSISY